MSKTIRVEDKTWDELDELKGKHETFNDVLSRLVDIRRMVLGIEPILRGQQAYQEFKDARAAQQGGVK